jgi:predicted CopG family antitoxin
VAPPRYAVGIQAAEEDEEQRRSQFLFAGVGNPGKDGETFPRPDGPSGDESFSDLLSKAMKKNEADVQQKLDAANKQADEEAARLRKAQEEEEKRLAAEKEAAAENERKLAAAAEAEARRVADQRRKEQDVRRLSCSVCVALTAHVRFLLGVNAPQVMTTLQQVLQGGRDAFIEFKDASAGFRSGTLDASGYVDVVAKLCGRAGARELLPKLVAALPSVDRQTSLQVALDSALTAGQLNDEPAVAEQVDSDPTNTDGAHLARLKAFFQANRPENVPRVPELFAKMGKSIWQGLELKYPGKTAEFTIVRGCYPLFASLFGRFT